MTESTLWQGRSSQWVNRYAFGISGLLAAAVLSVLYFFPALPRASAGALVVPLALAGIAWLRVRSRVYEMTTERFRTRSGILTQRLDELELYRVKDITMTRSIDQRVLGLGNLTLYTSDHTTPVLVIPSIARPETVHEAIRRQVQLERDRKKVREVDMNPEIPAGG